MCDLGIGQHTSADRSVINCLFMNIGGSLYDFLIELLGKNVVPKIQAC